MRYLISFMFFLLTSTAYAERNCIFTTECFAGDGCAESTFSLSYDVTACPIAPGPRGIVASTDFGDLRGTEIGNPICAKAAGESAFALDGPGASYMLLDTGDGAALSVMMEGPMAITYLGTCE